MLNILYIPKRFSKDGIVSERQLYQPRRTYQYYLNRFSGLPQDFSSKKYVVIDCGKIITNLRTIPRRKTSIIITPRIEWQALVAIGKAIWTVVSSKSFMYATMALVGAYSVYSYVSMKNRLPNFGLNGEGLDDGSPTYGWDGIHQVCEVGIPVSVIYGQHRTGGNVINEYVSSDGDKNYLHSLTCLCEGEIESIDEGQIDNNPIENYTGITVTKRYGTNDQTVIPNYEDLHNMSVSIDVEMLKDDPYVYTTVDEDVEAFEIHLSLPQGLWQQDEESGQLSAWSVTYQVEYKLHSAGSYTDLGTFTISEKNRSTVRRIFRKAGLTAGQYDIRITKTSDDSDDYHTGVLVLQYFDEIKCDDIKYVNSALVAVDALATNQLGNTAPNITWVVKGKKVLIPDVRTESGSSGAPVDWDDYYWDPDAEVFRLFADDSELYWDEVSYVTAYSANPIWCCSGTLFRILGMG
jgi:Phage-related protein, tail component